MNADAGVFGVYAPGSSPIHRLPVAVKLLLVLVVSIVSLAARNPWVTGAMLATVVTLLLLTGLRWRRCFQLAWPLVVLMAALAVYQFFAGTPALMLVVPVNLLVCLYASRVLVLTSPGPALLDALASAARPVRVVGIDPDRVALAISLMIRSIPHLLGAMTTVRDAARARGLERNPLTIVAPVVVQAIAYAQATGDALVARGLGERGNDDLDEGQLDADG